MLVAVLLLAACGSETTNEQPKQNESQPEEMEDVLKTSDDPLEVGNRNNDINIFQNGLTTEKVIGWYTSDITDEDGFNTIEFKDSEIRFSLALTEGEGGEQEISVFGEKINNMDVLLDFYETFQIKTDQQEVASPMFDFEGGIEPDTKSKFYDVFSLEYDIPESFTFTMKKPAEDEEESLLWFDERETITELEFNLE